MSTPSYAEEPPVAPSPHVVGGRWPTPVGADPLFQPAQAEEDENARGGGPFEEFLDPLREVRREQYEQLRSQLKDLEPSNRALQRLTGPNYSPTWADVDELNAALRDAQERADESPATTWELGWGARGIETELWRLSGQRRLPSNTPTIDNFSEHDVVTSIKSIDLNAASYRDPFALSRRVDRYVDKLASFESLNWGGIRIAPNEIRARVLDIVVPKNSGTSAQWNAITRSIERARRLGVHILVSPY